MKSITFLLAFLFLPLFVIGQKKGLSLSDTVLVICNEKHPDSLITTQNRIQKVFHGNVIVLNSLDTNLFENILQYRFILRCPKRSSNQNMYSYVLDDQENTIEYKWKWKEYQLQYQLLTLFESFDSILANSLPGFDSTLPDTWFYKDRVRIHSFGQKKSNDIKSYLKGVITISNSKYTGSGFFIGKNHVLTNPQALNQEKSLEAILYSGDTIVLELIKIFPELNLSILKTDYNSEFQFELRKTSKDFMVGEEVFAIGTPNSLEIQNTITSGIVSGFREFETIKLYQTDAPISEGMSGGPLITRDGKLLGVLATKLIGYDIEGMGFALSTDDLLKKISIIRF